MQPTIHIEVKDAHVHMESPQELRRLEAKVDLLLEGIRQVLIHVGKDPAEIERLISRLDQKSANLSAAVQSVPAVP